MGEGGRGRTLLSGVTCPNCDRPLSVIVCRYPFIGELYLLASEFDIYWIDRSSEYPDEELIRLRDSGNWQSRTVIRRGVAMLRQSQSAHRRWNLSRHAVNLRDVLSSVNRILYSGAIGGFEVAFIYLSLFVVAYENGWELCRLGDIQDTAQNGWSENATTSHTLREYRDFGV